MDSTDLNKQRQEVFNYIGLRLGSGIVDIELDQAHYEMCLDRAVSTYRQRASNSTEESYVWLELTEGENIYTLPREVTEVRQIFRRGFGMINGQGASSFDPFGASMSNYWLGSINQGSGGLFTYHLAINQLQQAERMFGGYINFQWNPSTKKITLVRNVHHTGEVVLLWCYNLRPEMELLNDLQVSQWLKDFSTAAAKEIIGQARSKFQTIAGPQGGTSLNGDAMKAEAKDEMDKLIEDLRNFVDGSDCLTWIQG